MHNRITLLALCLAAACSSAGPDHKADTSAQGSKDSTPQTTATPKGATTGGSGGELAYVTNEDSRELSVVDATTDRVVATIEVGTRPRGVHASTDGRTVFVALSGSPKCPRSEERRVGKECRSRWSPYH